MQGCWVASRANRQGMEARWGETQEAANHRSSSSQGCASFPVSSTRSQLGRPGVFKPQPANSRGWESNRPLEGQVGPQVQETRG